jgi:hypothetical protein
LTGRSARVGDVGEFIAAKVFDIELAATATQAGYDGKFRSGLLVGRSVNIKTYGDARNGLDMTSHPCEFYLVLSGSPAAGQAAHHRRWHIAEVYLFETARLRGELEARRVRIGIATSVRASDLQRAQIYPTPGDAAPLAMTAQQRNLLSLFA